MKMFKQDGLGDKHKSKKNQRNVSKSQRVMNKERGMKHEFGKDSKK